MPLARLSTKGQLVVPKDMRDRHGWRAGTQVELVDLGHAVVLRSPKPFVVTNLQDGFGLLHTEAAPLAPEQMDRAVDAWIRDEWRRS